MRALLLLTTMWVITTAADVAHPNIVFIYFDDLGYGDAGCYGSTRIPTPNIDRVAQEGIRFTSGYSASATCTPSRYALMTGEYPWRRKGTGILPGDAAMIIEPGRTTLPSVLQKAGYRTMVVGKWHLGLGIGHPEWNQEIRPCPLDVGFDRSFIMAATGDRVPCVFIQDRRVVGLDPADPISVSYETPFPGLPTGKANPELLRMHPSHGHDMAIVNGISRIGYMKGGTAALWKDEDMADTFTTQAQHFIEENKDKPFFLYFAMHDPHVPRVPHPRFVGTTNQGPRGDAIVQSDWSAGQIIATLERLGLTSNTLVIVSSDNGPVVDDGYKDSAPEKLGDHKPSGPLRGGKSSRFEAGTRVPFLVRWPGRVKPRVSEAIVCQIDFLASFAALVGQPLQPGDAPDSQNVLSALLGDENQGRDHIIEQGFNDLALRQGPWKFIPGGTKRDKINQLFNLDTDLGERTNIAEQHPEKITAMRALLEQEQTAGRTRKP